MLIYCTTNLITGKKYIGKQVDENKKNYLGSGTYFKRSLKKYGKDNFSKEILISGINDQKELSQIEIYLIAYYGAHKSDNYYNLCSGGEGGDHSGYKWDTENKKKFSNQLKEKYSVIENRTSFFGSRKGKKNTQENIEKLRQFNLGRPSCRRKPILQLTKTGVLIAEYESATAAYIALEKSPKRGDITMACKGTYEYCMGFKWKYKEEN